MACYFVINKIILILMILENSWPSECHLFTAFEQGLCGHKFNDFRDLETFVTRLLILRDIRGCLLR